MDLQEFVKAAIDSADEANTAGNKVEAKRKLQIAIKAIEDVINQIDPLVEPRTAAGSLD